MSVSIAILAAGEGKRMKSRLPKVLHPLAGKPILQHILDTAGMLDAEAIGVVYGHEGEQVKAALSDAPVLWIEQKARLGTGHAVQQALSYLPASEQILVLVGDAPLISRETLDALMQTTAPDQLGLVTVSLDRPHGLGRILRDDAGAVRGIVEERDATTEQRAIKEINTGIMLLPIAQLSKWLTQIDNNNAQQEFYLTDVIALAVQQEMKINTVTAHSVTEVQGINDLCQLAQLERAWQKNNAERLLLDGVTLRDPERFDVRGELTVGQDVDIDINVICEGRVTLGNNVTIGPHCVLRNVSIADNVEIKANSVLEDCRISSDCTIGPFARIRPGTQLAEKVKIGNFVEIKKATVGEGSSISHLSYIGDAVVGQHVNIGAGTITCNYDGATKHLTTIGDDVFVGSGTQLVAPLTVEKGATIGAGSTVRKDAPSNALTLSVGEQKTIPGWRRPKKEKKDFL